MANLISRQSCYLVRSDIYFPVNVLNLEHDRNYVLSLLVMNDCAGGAGGEVVGFGFGYGFGVRWRLRD